MKNIVIFLISMLLVGIGGCIHSAIDENANLEFVKKYLELHDVPLDALKIHSQEDLKYMDREFLKEQLDIAIELRKPFKMSNAFSDLTEMRDQEIINLFKLVKNQENKAIRKELDEFFIKAGGMDSEKPPHKRDIQYYRQMDSLLKKHENLFSQQLLLAYTSRLESLSTIYIEPLVK